MKNDPNKLKFSLLMNETIGWTFMMFEMNLISSIDYGLKFYFVHEFDWNSSTQVYEWKFIYSSSGIHGWNKIHLATSCIVIQLFHSWTRKILN